MKLVRLLLVSASVFVTSHVAVAADAKPQRPNILWLIAEDFGPHLSCYGTKEVWTPNLDRLAREGMRYDRFYCVAPVCSPSRSAFMTGMYQTTIGAHNHRSHRDDGYKLPDGVRVLTDWMRDAGYFTANLRTFPAGSDPGKGVLNVGTGKTDWNFTYEGKPFDSDNWDDLKTHQPFYAQVNFKETHRKFVSPKRADPAKVAIPPYYPDHPVTRKDWAEYLDAATELDEKVGKILKQLEADGLADNTVIVFFGDNGQAHVRGKQFCYEEGLIVPLIVHWPSPLPPSPARDLRVPQVALSLPKGGRGVGGERFARPQNFKPGTVSNRMLMSIDLAPTMLNLARAQSAGSFGIPPKMQGQPFLGFNGERLPSPRQYVFGARDRCDETVFRFRTVRDARYRYIRNFTPERPFLQANAYKERSYPVWNLLKQLDAEGKLSPAQKFLTAPTMPPEELYDMETDPYQINNLVNSPQPAHRAALKRLHGVLEKWIEETNDQGRNLEPPEIAAAKGVTKPGSDPNATAIIGGQKGKA